MNTKLTQAAEILDKLPQERQEELINALLKAANHMLIEEKLAASEASYAEHGGTPAEEVFGRLIKKYAS